MPDFIEYKSPLFQALATSSPTESNPTEESSVIVPTEVNNIFLNVKVKSDYKEIYEFVDELRLPNEKMSIDDRELSVFQLYTLHLLNDPVDMSSLNERKIYHPKLFIRKNDKFSPFNFYFLLNLFDIEYQLNPDQQFPEVWRTTFDTNVTVRVIEFSRNEDGRISSELNVDGHETRSLLDIFKIICREQNYDQQHATQWAEYFRDEQIKTLDQLRGITDESWEKLSKIPEVVKRFIIDYIKLNLDTVSSSFNQQTRDPYKTSKATLLADIHRVRRYFYHVIKKIDSVPYLSREVVDLAIEEVKKTYDDDGNILINIQNYLRTFCLENRLEDQAAHERKRTGWQEEFGNLKVNQKPNENKLIRLRNDLGRLIREIEVYEKRKENKDWSVSVTTNSDLSVGSDHQRTLSRTSSCIPDKENRSSNNDPNMFVRMLTNLLSRKSDETASMQEKHEAWRIKIQNQALEEEFNMKRQKMKQEYKQKEEEYWSLNGTIANNKVQMEYLQNLLQIDWKEQEKKLRVKYGRGLLLFGPPGTGKSELLKKVANYAGITMITQPLSAGELNRPYVGETEKLLVDIMSRANTIPYLICAMTIDEIDGLVPKRDSNAQQSKVDGISVLLSHIEGVKDIPNLIVFGATNRRNMMDEAFLRRMQAKVFVGRPSPTSRKHMLNPLIYKSIVFTSKRIDALVKITTNFSGAAVGALRSNIVVEMDRNPEINDRRLLELADAVAREFNVWFGISTLPSICRLNSNLFDPHDRAKEEENRFSLAFQDEHPSGRILIDLQDRKCFIELQEENKMTIERDLDVKETSVQSVLARLIQGCSTRNIDTIQVIDLNFLTKQNATEENQIFELLTTIFLECDEYNKSMLVFDIDSLIMLTKSDSDMSKSTSISNVRLYQFIREKCKTAIVERGNQNEQNAKQTDPKPVEKWIVIIVKENFLKTSLVNEIEFRKSAAQKDDEAKEEQKRLDDERSRRCPKCLKDYLPKNTKFGDCHYHDGFIVDVNAPDVILTMDQARMKMQQAELLREHEENATQKTPVPMLLWVCCGERFGNNQLGGCRISDCGLPDYLKDVIDMTSNDYIEIVQESFANNPEVVEKQCQLKNNLRSGIANVASAIPAASNQRNKPYPNERTRQQ